MVVLISRRSHLKSAFDTPKRDRQSGIHKCCPGSTPVIGLIASLFHLPGSSPKPPGPCLTISPQILFLFHFPCLNRIALTAAIELSAIAMEKNTPFDRICSGMARA